MKPLAIDLYAGLGGWAEGFLSEGYDVVGFDIERHRYRRILNRNGGASKRPGMSWSGSDDPTYKAVAFNRTADLEFSDDWDKYPAQLVLQDVLTLHGSQFRDATVIVGSSPCQEFSYRAMPWKRAKALPPPELGIRLFEAQFRIQREACEAAGRYIPLVVENVRGAQPWVGRAKWHYGSYYLWGDVPALMPMMQSGVKVPSESGRRTAPGNGARFTSRDCGVEGKALDGTKQGGDWFGRNCETSISRMCSSRSSARKAASAQIAKIPFPLAQWIAQCFKPVECPNFARSPGKVASDVPEWC